MKGLDPKEAEKRDTETESVFARVRDSVRLCQRVLELDAQRSSSGGAMASDDDDDAEEAERWRGVRSRWLATGGLDARVGVWELMDFEATSKKRTEGRASSSAQTKTEDDG